MDFTRFDEILPKNRKTENGNKRTGDVAACDWSVPIRVDRGCGTLDLNKTDGPDPPVPIRVLKNRTRRRRARVPACAGTDGGDCMATAVPAKTEGGGEGFRYP